MTTEFDQRYPAPLLRKLVDAELRFYGYTEEQIALTRLESPHTTGGCEFSSGYYGWQCEDENGESYHPEWDEADRVAGIIVRALEGLNDGERGAETP